MNLFLRFLCLVLYYGLCRYLPPSSSRLTLWIRHIRGIVCRPLFRYAGRNINIERGAFFGSGCKLSIRSNSGIGINCRVLGDLTLGDNVMIGPDVMFITTSHRCDLVTEPMIHQGYSDERPIIIGNDVWIGARCIILPGVIVGTGSIIGAGSVVTKNIPDLSIAAGNPARVLRSRYDRSLRG